MRREAMNGWLRGGMTKRLDGLRETLEQPESANQKAQRGHAAQDKLQRLVGQGGEDINADSQFGNVQQVLGELFALRPVERHQCV